MPLGSRSGWPQIGQYVGDPVTLNLGVATANVQLQQNSYYRLWGSVNTFIKFGADNTVTASTSSNPLTAGIDTLHWTGLNAQWMAGIVASGTGVLYASLLSTDAN
jgi:hypothetical protein